MRIGIVSKHLLPLVLLAGLLPGASLHGQIFVANQGSDAITEYTTSGTPVGSRTLVSAVLNVPRGIAVSGSDIFVPDEGNNTIVEYTTSGTPVGTGTLVSSGLDIPMGIAISGSDIFVVNNDNNTIGEYTTSGAPEVSGALISSGLEAPSGIAIVAPVPEPSTWAMLAAGAGLLICRNRRRLRASKRLLPLLYFLPGCCRAPWRLRGTKRS